VCVCIWWTAAGVKLQRWSTTSIGNVPEIRSSPCAIKNLAPPNLCWLSVKTIATEMVNRWYAVYYSGAFFFAYSRIHTVYEFHVQRSIASSLTWNMYIHTYTLARAGIERAHLSCISLFWVYCWIENKSNFGYYCTPKWSFASVSSYLKIYMRMYIQSCSTFQPPTNDFLTFGENNHTTCLASLASQVLADSFGFSW